MHAARKGDIYNAGNPGIGKSNTFISLPGNQGILIPRLSHPLPRKTPLGILQDLIAMRDR